MPGVNGDWVLSPKHENYTLQDYEGAVPRWCSGCGDLPVLSAVQKICRTEQLVPEKTVVVSGIGCSSRFPHYMKTYGFHGLHGRAFPVACGVKSRRPDLSIFVATGDGDCCAIGTAHWIHAIRYNMDMTVMLLDNNIYGLTKKQTSPTTRRGKHSNTHPRGSLINALNPISVTLGIENASFVAQTVDWNPIHLYNTLHQAHKHKGFSFVRILQRCPHFTSEVFEPCQRDPNQVLLMTHEKGIESPDTVKKIFTNQVEHDPGNLEEAMSIAANQELNPIGLFYQNKEALCYDDFSRVGLDMTVEQKMENLEKELERYEV